MCSCEVPQHLRKCQGQLPLAVANKLFCKRQMASLVSDKGNKIAVKKKKRTPVYNVKGTFQDVCQHAAV